MVAAPCSGVLKRVVERVAVLVDPADGRPSPRAAGGAAAASGCRPGGRRTRARRRPGRARRAGRRTARWPSSPARRPATCRTPRSNWMSSQRIAERWWPRRRQRDHACAAGAASAGQRRFVSAKWPRWLVANCASQPGPTRVSGLAMIAALLMRMSTVAAGRRGSARRRPCTLSRSPRSSSSTSTPRCRRAPRAARASRAPGRHDDVRAGAGERAGRLEAEPRVAAGDDGQLAGQVDAGDDLGGGGGGAEAGSDRVLRAGHAPTVRPRAPIYDSSVDGPRGQATNSSGEGSCV